MGIELTTSNLRQYHKLPDVQHVHATEIVSKHNPNDMGEVSISTLLCIKFELCPISGDIHSC